MRCALEWVFKNQQWNVPFVPDERNAEASSGTQRNSSGYLYRSNSCVHARWIQRRSNSLNVCGIWYITSLAYLFFIKKFSFIHSWHMAYRYHGWTNFITYSAYFDAIWLPGCTQFRWILYWYFQRNASHLHVISMERHWKANGSLGLFEINQTRLTHFSSLYNLHRLK